MSDLQDLLRPRPKPSTPGTLIYLLFGPILWAIQLTVVYGGHTLVCSQGGTAAAAHSMTLVVSAVIGIADLAFLLAPGAFARGLGLTRDMDARRAYERVAWVGGALALVAIVWTGTTVLVVDACLQGR